jgi:hypothetical protein
MRGFTRFGRCAGWDAVVGWQMGFLRHRADEPEGERFLMREKLLAIGDDFWIENDRGERWSGSEIASPSTSRTAPT